MNQRHALTQLDIRTERIEFRGVLEHLDVDVEVRGSRRGEPLLLSENSNASLTQLQFHIRSNLGRVQPIEGLPAHLHFDPLADGRPRGAGGRLDRGPRSRPLLDRDDREDLRPSRAGPAPGGGRGVPGRAAPEDPGGPAGGY